MRQNKVVNNATWMIACNIVHVLCGVLINALTARFLGPADFGLINYAASIVAFFVPVMQLGLGDTLVKEVIDHPEKEGLTVGTATLMNVLSSLLCMAGSISVAALLNHGDAPTVLVCAIYSTQLFVRATEIVVYWFHAKYRSKTVSLISLVAYFVVSAYRVYLLATGKSVYWFAVAGSLDLAIISISLLVLYRRSATQRFSVSFSQAKEMLKRSFYYVPSNLLITVFSSVTAVMLKSMIDVEATGFYTIATTCVGFLAMVFPAIINASRPAILEAKKKSETDFENSLVGLYSVVIYLSLLANLMMTLFAPLIVGILYGASYMPAVSILQILTWYTTFSYLGSIRNIWILAKEKQKYLWLINLLGALFNIVANLVLIPLWGVNGAALASLLTQFFANVIVSFFIPSIRRNNLFVLRSLNPRLLLSYTKSVLKRR